ncbi:hypothetical protein F5Y18DRAFT_336486 [Xylariaceae sp. FL1019]|nr:hypothetical protein F5Y18DRAFT_336486 [Xylariaceae sp. FL1019]
MGVERDDGQKTGSRRSWGRWDQAARRGRATSWQYILATGLVGAKESRNVARAAVYKWLCEASRCELSHNYASAANLGRRPVAELEAHIPSRPVKPRLHWNLGYLEIPRVLRCHVPILHKEVSPTVSMSRPMTSFQSTHRLEVLYYSKGKVMPTTSLRRDDKNSKGLEPDKLIRLKRQPLKLFVLTGWRGTIDQGVDGESANT